MSWMLDKVVWVGVPVYFFGIVENLNEFLGDVKSCVLRNVFLSE